MDLDGRKVLVIIPAHNEEGRIGGVVSSVGKVLPEAHVVVIDDCSTDSTGREAAAAGAAVLTHAVNLGYGAALETGYIYAVRRGYDCVIQMDGDGQHPADELPALLAPVMNGDADLVLGSRYLSGGRGYRTPFLRRLGQRIFGGIVQALAHVSVTDPTSGFQCLSRKALKLFSSGVFPADFPDADVLLMAHYAGLKVVEVPVRMLERSEGVSMHSGLRPVYYGMKMFLSIFLVVLNYRRWKEHVA